MIEEVNGEYWGMRDDLSLPKIFILDPSMGRAMSVEPAKVSAVRSLICKGSPMPTLGPQQQGAGRRVSGV